MIEILKRNYKKIYFWPQGDIDLDYLEANFDTKGISILDRNMEAYESCLKSEIVDYVGTRLHGGIHALYHKRRTIIISVDNRAKEISRDVNLPVLEMKDIKALLENKIQSKWKTDLHIDKTNIEKWMKEFEQILGDC